MWLLKLELKHDCKIGNRCERFGVVAFSMPLSNWKKNGHYFISERHTLEGEKAAVDGFLNELKRDRSVAALPELCR